AGPRDQEDECEHRQRSRARHGILLVRSAHSTRAAPGWRIDLCSTRPAEVLPMTADLDALTDLNRDYIHSVQHSDVERFREILADDFLCSLPDGSLLDRGRFLERTARPPGIANLEAHDVNVRLMGDFAIIHGRTTYTTADGGSGTGRYTDVWARRGGRWLAVSAHVTRG